LTRQLLAFSRKQIIQPVVLDLNAATGELEKMLGRLIGENIDVTFERSPGLGRVKIDLGQIEQILMNLAVNARDTMPRGGSLCIETANVELDETFARQTLNVRPGSYVMLSVSTPVAAWTRKLNCAFLSRSSRPSRPTMEPDWDCPRSMESRKQNTGYIMVSSEVGKGTTFRFYLPRLGDDVQLSLPPEALKAIPRGTEVVLVVEDEEPMRVLARTCLESNGYSVLDAPDAATALQLATEHRGLIHLLLTDVVMPGMSGPELAKCLLVLQPGVKVVYMSGYANDLIDQQGILDRDTVLLEKPFTLHALLTKVYQALHTEPSGKAAVCSN
jgi:CheY-like chemotaxis protein